MLKVIYAVYLRQPPKMKRALRTLLPQAFLEKTMSRQAIEMQGSLEGLKMYGLDIGNYLDESHEKQVSDLIVRLVRPGQTCLDVGAHKGYFSLMLARLVGFEGRVVAFEAHPENAQMLRRNVKLNGYADVVEVENLAISDTSEGKATLHAGRRSASAEWTIITEADSKGRPAKPAIAVGQTTLDDYFGSEDHIDFIKIDVEGAEARVLAGAKRVILDQDPVLLIEFHNSKCWESARDLVENGYILYDVERGRWIRELDISPYHCLAVPEKMRHVVELAAGHAGV